MFLRRLFEYGSVASGSERVCGWIFWQSWGLQQNRMWSRNRQGVTDWVCVPLFLSRCLRQNEKRTQIKAVYFLRREEKAESAVITPSTHSSPLNASLMNGLEGGGRRGEGGTFTPPTPSPSFLSHERGCGARRGSALMPVSNRCGDNWAPTVLMF